MMTKKQDPKTGYNRFLLDGPFEVSDGPPKPKPGLKKSDEPAIPHVDVERPLAQTAVESLQSAFKKAFDLESKRVKKRLLGWAGTGLIKSDQPRVPKGNPKGGQFAKIGPGSTISTGDKIKVYRASGEEPGGLDNRNAGDTTSVAVYLDRQSSDHGPTFKNPITHIHEYEVEILGDVGKYQQMSGGEPKLYDFDIRNGKEIFEGVGVETGGGGTALSFRPGTYKARHVRKAPVSAVRSKLKEIDGNDNIGWHGTVSVRDAIESLFPSEDLGKADTPDPEFDIDAFLAAVQFELAEDLAETVTESLSTVYADSAGEAAVTIGADRYSEIVDVVNPRAVNWAAQYAAEMLGLDEDNEYGVTQTTRNMVGKTITDGLSSGKSTEQIADDIADSYAFSEDRARVIAETEVASANSMGALEGYKEVQAMGVTVLKSWLILGDACSVCHENADAGMIPLDDSFPSGDMAPPAHPHCRCVIVPHPMEEPVEKADQPREPKGSSKGGQWKSTGVLTDKQHDAIGWYMADGGGTVNDSFRSSHSGGKHDLTDEEWLNVSRLDDAIKTSKTAEGVKVYRGVQSSPFDGDGYHPGYLSTTTDIGASTSFTGDNNTILEIHVPKGQKSLKIESGGYGSPHDEVIFPRGSRLNYGDSRVETVNGVDYTVVSATIGKKPKP